MEGAPEMFGNSRVRGAFGVVELVVYGMSAPMMSRACRMRYITEDTNIHKGVEVQ